MCRAGAAGAAPADGCGVQVRTGRGRRWTRGFFHSLPVNRGLGLGEPEGCRHCCAVVLSSGPSPPNSFPKITTCEPSAGASPRYPWKRGRLPLSPAQRACRGTAARARREVRKDLKATCPGPRRRPGATDGLSAEGPAVSPGRPQMPFCLCEVDVLRCGDSRLPPGSEITLPNCGGKLTLGLVPQPTAHTPAVQVAQCPELTQPLERGDRGPETVRGTPEVLLLALGPRLWDPYSGIPSLEPPLWDPHSGTTLWDPGSGTSALGPTLGTPTLGTPTLGSPLWGPQLCEPGSGIPCSGTPTLGSPL